MDPFNCGNEWWSFGMNAWSLKEPKEYRKYSRYNARISSPIFWKVKLGREKGEFPRFEEFCILILYFNEVPCTVVITSSLEDSEYLDLFNNKIFRDADHKNCVAHVDVIFM
jgi:hypothetical protein